MSRFQRLLLRLALCGVLRSLMLLLCCGEAQAAPPPAPGISFDLHGLNDYFAIKEQKQVVWEHRLPSGKLVRTPVLEVIAEARCPIGLELMFTSHGFDKQGVEVSGPFLVALEPLRNLQAGERARLRVFLPDDPRVKKIVVREGE